MSQQLKKYEETQSAFSVVKKHFFTSGDTQSLQIDYKDLHDEWCALMTDEPKPNTPF